MARCTYWNISNGLRGCYMADSMHIVRVRTRRGLKEALRDQDPSDDAPSDRAVASLAAAAWRYWVTAPRAVRATILPICEPYPGNKGYGLFVGPATREEWLESREAEED